MLDSPELKAAIRERLNFIAANRERLLEAWVAETGVLPSDAMLIEDYADPLRLKVYVRRRHGAKPMDQTINGQYRKKIARYEDALEEILAGDTRRSPAEIASEALSAERR